LRLFIDECLSPQLAQHLNATGIHDATHPRDIGRLDEPDYLVLARCIAEDRVIVTENAADFRRLVARQDIHPGLIILPSVGLAQSRQLLTEALIWLAAQGNDRDVMINHVLEVAKTDGFRLLPLP
jgi:predicted nuclease of predicted toxin-antitoxin system